MARPLRLMDVFVELADSLTEEFEVADFLERLCMRCAELLDVPAAAILLVDRRGELEAVAATDERTRVLAQSALQQTRNPCVECYRSGTARVNIDLTDPAVSRTWRPFAIRAAGAGFRMAHTVPLRVREETAGALTLFHSERVRLWPEDSVLAQALADIATAAVLQQRALEDSRIEAVRFQSVLDALVVIEQAKGVLAERWNSSVEQAFTALSGYARTHRLRVSELAHAVIDGRLDTMLITPPPPAEDGPPEADLASGPRTDVPRV